MSLYCRNDNEQEQESDIQAILQANLETVVEEAEGIVFSVCVNQSEFTTVQILIFSLENSKPSESDSSTQSERGMEGEPEQGQSSTLSNTHFTSLTVSVAAL